MILIFIYFWLEFGLIRIFTLYSDVTLSYSNIRSKVDYSLLLWGGQHTNFQTIYNSVLIQSTSCGLQENTNYENSFPIKNKNPPFHTNHIVFNRQNLWERGFSTWTSWTMMFNHLSNLGLSNLRKYGECTDQHTK